MGQFLLDAGNANVNPALLSWVQAAAAQSPFNVRLQSGYREGDPRYHGKKMAIDVQLIDPKTNKVIQNYQTADSFAAYQQFANSVRGAQQQANPELANQLRWGGYFSGEKGKYGALDLMHFDIGGDQTPMGGGGWDTGLTPAQAKLWGLAPGGGYTGAGAVAPVLSDAVAGETIPEEEKFTFPSLSSSGGRSSVPEIAEPRATRAMPPPIFDAGTAKPAAAGLLAPPGALASAVAPLAELFQVGDIGQASVIDAQRAQRNPYAPPRRREA